MFKKEKDQQWKQSLGSRRPLLEKENKLYSIFSRLPNQVLGLGFVLDGRADHTELPVDSPLSSNAENSHPQRSPGLAPSLQRSLSELSPRPRLAPTSQSWLAKPNGGQGDKQKERQQSRSKELLHVGKSKGVDFGFFISQGWENPSHTWPQSLVGRDTGFSKAIVLFGVLFPLRWANYTLLNQHWTPWGLLGHRCLGEPTRLKTDFLVPLHLNEIPCQGAKHIVGFV